MVSTLLVNGVASAVPRASVKVNASALNPVVFTGVGPVVIIGEVEGGKPVSAMLSADEILSAGSDSAVRKAFRSGDLLEACSMVFAPSDDERVPGGASEVIPLKVNPATKSSAPVDTAANGAVLDLTSLEYGAFTKNISYQVSTASATAKNISVTFEGNTATGSTLGGTGAAKPTYEPDVYTGTWDTMRLAVRQEGTMTAYGTRTESGLATDVTGPIAPGNKVYLDGASVSDAGVVVTVYGVRTTSGVADQEVLTLDANGKATGTKAWDKVLGARVNAGVTLAGAVPVKDTNSSGTAIVTLAATLDSSKGIVAGEAMFVADDVVAVRSPDNALAEDILIVGRNASNAVVLEKLPLPANTVGNDIPVFGTQIFSKIEYIVLGDLLNAEEMDLLAESLRINPSEQDSLAKVKTHFANRADDLDADPLTPAIGFDLSLLIGQTSLTSSIFDEVRDLDIYNATPTLTMIATSMNDYLNASSAYVSSAFSSFTAKDQTITLSPAIYVYYVDITVGSSTYRASYVSPAATIADIQAGLIAAINGTPIVKAYVVASAVSTNQVKLTALQGLGFTLSHAGANMTITTTTAGVGAKVAPADTAGPVFLAGGIEGVTAQEDWQAALDLLRPLRVGTIVPLTGDPSVHAILEAHLEWRAGLGESEADGVVGLSALDGSGEPTGVLPNKQSVKDQIVGLNTRHLSACFQSIERFNIAGTRRTFEPWFQAVICAGMQAGADLGRPLTHKYGNVLSIAQDSSINIEDDANEMLQSGALFMQKVRNKGFYWVRAITTHLTSNNLAFTERNLNQAINFVVFEVREELKRAIGENGDKTTLTDLKNSASKKLGELVSGSVNPITDFRSLTLSVSGSDVLDFSCEVEFPPPINFVDATLNLQLASITVS